MVFSAPEAIARLFDQPVPLEWVPRGQRDPREILRQHAEKSPKAWDFTKSIEVLDNEDVEKIRALAEVREIEGFLMEMKKRDQAA